MDYLVKQIDNKWIWQGDGHDDHGSFSSGATEITKVDENTISLGIPDTWIKRDERWQMVAAHVSKMATPASPASWLVDQHWILLTKANSASRLLSRAIGESAEAEKIQSLGSP
ncbi:MAG: hypothetical protein AB9869_04650 [Verrucomicrobiia bacterium]